MVVESRLPAPGQLSSASYEGDGYVIVRHPDTAAVTEALRRLVTGVRVELGLTAMNVIMLSPGYPAEMAFFSQALAAAGATVIGVGDQPPPGRSA